MQRRNSRPLTLPKEPDGDEAEPSHTIDPAIPTLDDKPVDVAVEVDAIRDGGTGRLIDERARIIRTLEAETALLRRAQVTADGALTRLIDLDADRRRVYSELATAKGEAARYRQLVVDLEDNAPPPFFGPGGPDDLKLIVGVGPVLERMLQQLGITTYRQIARWTERDIDEFDAKLPEFPGRIRRDGWVTQARARHASKYGAPPSARDR